MNERPSLLHSARRLARRLGVDVQPWRPQNDPAVAHAAILRHTAIDVVLDVGAATGGYARMLREAGHRGRIISCEPLPEAFKLLESSADGDPDWEVLCAAVGAEPGRSVLHVAGNVYSSSLLPMLERHTRAAPESAIVRSIEVPVTTVRAILDETIGTEDRVLLKLDVQGAESAVLDGTPFERITAIHLEQSLVELYERSAVFDQLHPRILDAGFQLVDVTPGLRDPQTAQLLQFDATYLRRPG
ncbi:MAG: FkbM family methyltransferase [Actinomycetota bacterium]